MRACVLLCASFFFFSFSFFFLSLGDCFPFPESCQRREKKIGAVERGLSRATATSCLVRPCTFYTFPPLGPLPSTWVFFCFVLGRAFGLVAPHSIFTQKERERDRSSLGSMCFVFVWEFSFPNIAKGVSLPLLSFIYFEPQSEHRIHKDSEEMKISLHPQTKKKRRKKYAHQRQPDANQFDCHRDGYFFFLLVQRCAASAHSRLSWHTHTRVVCLFSFPHFSFFSSSRARVCVAYFETPDITFLRELSLFLILVFLLSFFPIL